MPTGAKMTDNISLMTFPCDFQIKVIGKNTATFTDDIINISRKHFPNTSDEAIRSQPSQQSNYIALGVTIHALNQTTIDALYQELTQHPDVKMVL